MPIALLALTLSAFAIGTTEFVIVGLLPTIAADLGVSLPSAGLLVSLYALGVAIGAPVLTALTGKLPRKSLLSALMALFTLGNLLAWQAPSYESLIAARILTGLAHGVFFSIGSTIATGLVPKEKAASAIAIMFTGLTVALVTGVPLGTFIGQHFGWRETFLAVSALGVIAFIGSPLFVPNNIRHTHRPRWRSSCQGAGRAAPAAGVCQDGDRLRRLVHSFTFLAPILQDVSGFSAGTVGWVMLVYGISVAVGNIWGGKLADRTGPDSSAQDHLRAAGRRAVGVHLHGAANWLALATVLVWGAVAFGNVPGLQVYVVQQAEHHTPQAVDVASGLNIAAFNLGIAGGAWAGGLIVTHLGLIHTAWIGALVVLVALALTAWSGRLDRLGPVYANR